MASVWGRSLYTAGRRDARQLEVVPVIVRIRATRCQLSDQSSVRGERVKERQSQKGAGASTRRVGGAAVAPGIRVVVADGVRGRARQRPAGSNGDPHSPGGPWRQGAGH